MQAGIGKTIAQWPHCANGRVIWGADCNRPGYGVSHALVGQHFA